MWLDLKKWAVENSKVIGFNLENEPDGARVRLIYLEIMLYCTFIICQERFVHLD